MKLTKKRKQHVADYVREVADVMRLRDWEIEVVFDTPSLDEERPDDTGLYRSAQLETTRGRKHALMTIAPDVLENSDESDIRQMVCHELLHVHTSGLWHWIRIQILENGDVTQQFYDVFMAGTEEQLEFGIDGIADAMALLLPEFSWSS